MEKPVKVNAKYKGNGWSAQKLERIYANRKLTILGPLAMGAAVLLLFLIFGENPDKLILVQDSIFVSALIYGAVLLVVGIQLLNPYSSPDFLDNALLLFTVVVGFGALWQVAGFLFRMREGFHIGLVGICTCPSALALIQSRRK